MVAAPLLAALALVAGACAGDPCPPRWRPALDDHGGVLLAGWGRAGEDPWLVGGGLGDGGARLVRVHDGATRELTLDRLETMWWVWGSPDGTIWMVGERGVILRGDDDGFAVLPSGTEATLYGVWGRAADDVWIVGGTVDPAGADDAVVLRWDGAALRAVALPRRDGAVFKVWGPDDGDDVWLAGEAGAIWRWHGGELVDHRRDTAASVLTVHGCAADEVYAVGGAHVWRWDGATWGEVPDLPSIAMATGVACGRDEVLVVGVQGARLRLDRGTGGWTDDTLDPFVNSDLHGAWADPDGELWALGGDYLAPAGGGARRGIAVQRACATGP